jgi:ubiquinol-cytochrome c reductase cytochrome b subunit
LHRRALRMMPAWEIDFLGHTLSLSVLLPAVLPVVIIFVGLASWPWFEAWATGDRSYHHVNDRPRVRPVRSATGMAAIVFYGVLWAEGANDVISDKLQISLYTVTWIARVPIFAGPAVAFYVTRRVCLGLQRRDAEDLEHGFETGIIRQLPTGEFIEERRPLPEEGAAILAAKKEVPALPAPGATDANGVRAPDGSGVLGVLRARANAAFSETVAAGANGHAMDSPAPAPGARPAQPANPGQESG